tara:strand:+ start:2174 stop:2509 length:336 start_codon:yes stop_codon:yes gene_type:complete
MTTLELIATGIITALTSANAWQFWQGRSKRLQSEKRAEQKEKNLYRDDLRGKVEKLESYIEMMREQRDEEMKEMSNRIISLHEEIASLRTKVSYLEEENTRLRGQNGSIRE